MRVRVVCLAALLVACHSPTAADLRSDQRAELQRQWSAWRAHNIRDYQFEYGLSCCWFRTNYQFEVRGDTNVSVVALDSTSAHVPVTPYTMDSVFAAAAAGLADTSATVTITYDPQLAFPTYIRIWHGEPDASFADTTRGFQRL